LHYTAFTVFYENSILHLIFFLRGRYVPHNKKSRKKNYVFNLKKMHKKSCIKIKTRENKPCKKRIKYISEAYIASVKWYMYVI